jgi:hypothetical protein
MNVWTAPWSTVMRLETKYLRLCTAVALGSGFGDWPQRPRDRILRDLLCTVRLLDMVPLASLAGTLSKALGRAPNSGTGPQCQATAALKASVADGFKEERLAASQPPQGRLFQAAPSFNRGFTGGGMTRGFGGSRSFGGDSLRSSCAIRLARADLKPRQHSRSKQEMISQSHDYHHAESQNRTPHPQQ